VRHQIRASKPQWLGSHELRFADANLSVGNVLLAALDTRFELVREFKLIFEEVFDPFTKLLYVVAGECANRLLDLLHIVAHCGEYRRFGLRAQRAKHTIIAIIRAVAAAKGGNKDEILDRL